MLKCRELPVAIVGGGIAGLALGRALHQGSVPFSIAERRQSPADGGLAIILPGNAIEALGRLGLREPIEALGHPLRRRQYRTAGDKLLCQIDEDDFWGLANRPRSVIRSDLTAMLADGSPTDQIRRGVEVQKISLHPGHAALQLTGGSSLDARLVVGADGVNSQVRAQAFTGLGGATLASIADSSWRFMAPNPGVDCWTLWAGTEAMVLLAPVGNDVVYGWAALIRKGSRGGTASELDRLTCEFPERVRRAIMHARSHRRSLYHSPLQEVLLDCWHRGRAVLIGDAAHATAPVWAQGAALALEDAIVLAASISDHADVQAALVDFQNKRIKRITHVRTLTDAMSRAAKLPPIVRNLLLPIVGPRRYRQTYGPLKEAA